MINVLPIVLVPLIVERKRIKQHPDVQKLQMLQSCFKTSAAISNTASDVKEYVGDKNKILKINVNLKSLLENMILPILRKRRKLAKQNRKDADKMNKILKKY